MKAVVMAGGKGTRLAPYTKILPKPLLPIGDMPILEVLIRQMKQAGVDEIFLTVGHLSELLRAFFQDGEQWGVKINYCYEDFPMGTVGALAQISGLNETFLMTNGDVLTTLDPQALFAFHKRQQAKIYFHFSVMHTNGSYCLLLLMIFNHCLKIQGGQNIPIGHQKSLVQTADLRQSANRAQGEILIIVIEFNSPLFTILKKSPQQF